MATSLPSLNPIDVLGSGYDPTQDLGSILDTGIDFGPPPLLDGIIGPMAPPAVLNPIGITAPPGLGIFSPSAPASPGILSGLLGSLGGLFHGSASAPVAQPRTTTQAGTPASVGLFGSTSTATVVEWGVGIVIVIVVIKALTGKRR